MFWIEYKGQGLALGILDGHRFFDDKPIAYFQGFDSRIQALLALEFLIDFCHLSNISDFNIVEE